MNAPLRRLSILAGFLGSGKTTWLRHQLRLGVFAGADVIVNEAAGLAVDHHLLGGRSIRLIAGGCACCERIEALLECLRGLVAEGGHARVVLETSGLADPAAIRARIEADRDLSSRLVVSEVLVAVEASHGLQTLIAEPLARRQVLAADAVVITKVDDVDPDVLAVLQASLQALVPHRPMFGAAHGHETALPDPGAALPVPLGAAADLPAPQVETLDLQGVADWPALALWLSALVQARGPDILRIKGVVDSPAGRLLVQAVGGRLALPEVVPDGVAETGRLVVIGRGYAAGALGASLRVFGRS